MSGWAKGLGVWGGQERRGHQVMYAGFCAMWETSQNKTTYRLSELSKVHILKNIKYIK